MNRAQFRYLLSVVVGTFASTAFVAFIKSPDHAHAFIAGLLSGIHLLLMRRCLSDLESREARRCAVPRLRDLPQAWRDFRESQRREP